MNSLASRLLPAFLLMLVVALTAACHKQAATRGIADERTDFSSFLPMKADPARDGLKRVNPYFRRADRAQILRAIEQACQGHRSGSSHYDPRTASGYYVNCNPKNRQ